MGEKEGFKKQIVTPVSPSQTAEREETTRWEVKAESDLYWLKTAARLSLSLRRLAGKAIFIPIFPIFQIPKKSKSLLSLSILISSDL